MFTASCRDGYLTAARLKTIVLDEADELFSRGFEDQVYSLRCSSPPSLPRSISAQSCPKATNVSKFCWEFLANKGNLQGKSGETLGNSATFVGNLSQWTRLYDILQYVPSDVQVCLPPDKFRIQSILHFVFNRCRFSVKNLGKNRKFRTSNVKEAGGIQRDHARGDCPNQFSYWVGRWHCSVTNSLLEPVYDE